MSLRFRGEDKVDSEAGWFSNDGDTYTVTLPTDSFAAKKPGKYTWFAVMTGSGATAGRQETVAQGTLIVKPNPEKMTAGSSALTFAERMVRAIRLRLEKRADHDILSYGVAGRNVMRMNVTDLEKQLGKWEMKVWQEKHPGQLGPGVEFRFGAPR